MALRTTRHASLGRARAGKLIRRFGSELRLARTAAGLTQWQLARLAGVSQSVVSRAERALANLQAQLRAAQLKRSALTEQLGQAVRLVMAVPDTRRARRVIQELLPVLRSALPASSRAVRVSIRSGSPLGADGILFLPLHHVDDGAPD